MKSTDRTILLVVPLIAVLAGLWLLVISPKREAASESVAELATLRSELSSAQAQVQEGELARRSFPRDYADVVSLGAAAPEDGGQATLIYDMSNLGQDNNVRFRSYSVTQTSTPAAGDASAAVPTEAAVATLPIGATVGPAGLPMVPYDFKFFGSFFNVADFFADLDDQVDVQDGKANPSVDGRLLTVNGFALTAHPVNGFPDVQADFSVSTYAVPATQGIDGGATPTDPSATTVAAPVTPAPAPTAAVAP